MRGEYESGEELGIESMVSSSSSRENEDEAS